MSDQGSAIMGQLLLMGWSMDSDVCDECNMPYMKQRATKRVLCVACQQELGSKLLAGGQISGGEGQSGLTLVCKGGSEKYSVIVDDNEMKLGKKIEKVPVVAEQNPVVENVERQHQNVEKRIVAQESKIQMKTHHEPQRSSGVFGAQQVTETLQRKQFQLCQRLEEETNPRKLSKLLDTMNQIYDTLGKGRSSQAKPHAQQVQAVVAKDDEETKMLIQELIASNKLSQKKIEEMHTQLRILTIKISQQYYAQQANTVNN